MDIRLVAHRDADASIECRKPLKLRLRYRVFSILPCTQKGVSFPSLAMCIKVDEVVW